MQSNIEDLRSMRDLNLESPVAQDQCPFLPYPIYVGRLKVFQDPRFADVGVHLKHTFNNQLVSLKSTIKKIKDGDFLPLFDHERVSDAFVGKNRHIVIEHNVTVKIPHFLRILDIAESYSIC